MVFNFFYSEWITSVICLPLISHGKAGAGTDWICIAVGLNTGFLKFYTEVSFSRWVTLKLK